MIDTHCHIDDEQYQTDFNSFVKDQRDGGVTAIVVPGVNTESLITVPHVCARYPNYLFPALGIHPEEIKDDFEQQLRKIYNALFQPDAISFVAYPEKSMPHPAPTWIAVGEIGLDYHFDTTYKEEQKKAFCQQLEWAIQKDLPVLIHSRDATEDCINVLNEYTKRGLRGIMHCFSGSRETAEIYVKMGLYLGIGGVITFKNSKLAENLKTIPLEHLVLETDAPYMSPVPFRGRRNESRWMVYVMEKLAQVYNCSTDFIDKQTTINAKHLFGI